MSEIVLVTGASGFVASHIVKQLLESGRQVRGTVRSLENEDKVKFLKDLPNASTNLNLIEADLLKEDSWKDAVANCKYVIHVASPFPNSTPSNPDDIIKPAVDGTLAVLKAASESGTVKRIVLTSSCLAVYDTSIPPPKENETLKPLNEESWSNVDDPHHDVYGKSKVLAERAAWDFVKELPEGKKLELVCINPGLVLGPVLNKVVPTSLEVVQRLLDRAVPAVARLALPVTDVRDVAQAHVKALTIDEAVGNRHIILSSCIWMKELALVLQKEFKPQGYSIPTMTAPNFFVWMTSILDKTYKLVLPRLSRYPNYTNKRMIDVLGIEPTNYEKTIIDTANSLIELGLVKKPKKQKKSKEEKVKDTAEAVKENGQNNDQEQAKEAENVTA